MFEDYIQDAYFFFQLAEKEVSTGNERGARMYYRAAIFCAASSMEAFVNFIGDTFKKGNTIDKNEIAFLNDKILEVNTSKALIEEKVKFNPLDSKLKFILKRFRVPIDISISSEWSGFLTFKSLRDSLIHPKSINDELSLEDYKIKIRIGLNSNIDLMNTISMTLFSKPIRRGLLDLKIS